MLSFLHKQNINKEILFDYYKYTHKYSEKIHSSDNTRSDCIIKNIEISVKSNNLFLAKMFDMIDQHFEHISNVRDRDEYIETIKNMFKMMFKSASPETQKLMEYVISYLTVNVFGIIDDKLCEDLRRVILMGGEVSFIRKDILKKILVNDIHYLLLVFRGNRPPFIEKILDFVFVDFVDEE